MKKKPKPNSKKKPSNEYLKYSGLAFQLLGVILIGYFLGHWLDNRFARETPVFTIVFTLLFVIIGLVLVIRDLLKQ